MSHDPAQSESRRVGDSFPVGHGPLLSWRGKARGAPGDFEPWGASIVLRWTLAGRGRCVLLTTRLLIEEPEGQHDQGDDQADLEDEKEQWQQESRSKLPQHYADETDRGELHNRL